VHWTGYCSKGLHGDFLGAKCLRKPILVEPKIAEAMVALWAILFRKEVRFFKVVFDGYFAQVEGEILSNPPYLSSSGHLIESIAQERNCFGR
jgi:hypothetical protein